MLEALTQKGKEFAEEFVKSEQDIFVMTTDANGEQVTITIKFSPPCKQISVEDLFRERFERKSTLTRL